MPISCKDTMSRFRHSEAGFMLTEILIAMTIFLVGGMAIAIMLDTSINYTASARKMTEATEIARHQMETLMSVPYNDMLLDAEESPFGPFTVEKHKVSWTVQEDTPLAGMKTIRVAVSWDNRAESKKLYVSAIRQ